MRVRRLSASCVAQGGLRPRNADIIEIVSPALQANDIARCDVTSGATSRQVDVTSVIGGESGSHTPATSLLVTMTSYPPEF